jgi:hypothetical protein
MFTWPQVTINEWADNKTMLWDVGILKPLIPQVSFQGKFFSNINISHACDKSHYYSVGDGVEPDNKQNKRENMAPEDERTFNLTRQCTKFNTLFIHRTCNVLHRMKHKSRTSSPWCYSSLRNKSKILHKICPEALSPRYTRHRQMR